MSLMDLFRNADEKCEVCRVDIKDGRVESHGKNFCSIGCMQEYMIRMQESKLKRAGNKLK